MAKTGLPIAGASIVARRRQAPRTFVVGLQAIEIEVEGFSSDEVTLLVHNCENEKDAQRKAQEFLIDLLNQ